MWVLIQASQHSNMKPDDVLLHLHFLKITAATPLSFQMPCLSSLPSFNSLTVFYLRCNKNYYTCSREFMRICACISVSLRWTRAAVAVPHAVAYITISVTMQIQWITSHSSLTSSSQRKMYKCSTKVILHVQAHVATLISASELRIELL